MLATHQLRQGDAVLTASPPPRATVRPRAAEVLVPGGPFTMGTSTEPWALDNERPAHQVHVDPFVIDVAAVTNADYAAFIDAGGYDDPRWWSAPGWAHRQDTGITAPRFWTRIDGVWWHRQFGVPAAAGAAPAGGPRQLPRGGGLRRLGGQAPAHRGRVGEGRAARPCHRPLATLPVGR